MVAAPAMASITAPAARRRKKSPLENWTDSIAKTSHRIITPVDFSDYNEMIGNPVHPNTGQPTPIFDYQLRYYEMIRDRHRVILNKSRKIGATETALRTLSYGCFDHARPGRGGGPSGRIQRARYANHNIMVVSGNKQEMANEFITRFKSIFLDGFTDMAGSTWTYDDIIVGESSSTVEMYSGAILRAYPANESVRGAANVKAIFFSEAAFPGIKDDVKIYNALDPNVENIEDADYIIESTPNGMQNVFYDRVKEAAAGKGDFAGLEQPYTMALGKMLFKDRVESIRASMSKSDFEQEYCCLFKTAASSEFDESEIRRDEELVIDRFEDI